MLNLPMRFRKASSSAPALPQGLRVNDLLFVNEYMSNGRNGTAAYQKLHAKCSRSVASSRAYQVLHKPSVIAELARRVQAEQGWSKETAVGHVLDLITRAQAQNKLETELHALMELNDLAGHKVHKVADVSDAESQLTPQQRVDRLAAIRQHYPTLFSDVSVAPRN